MDERAVILNVKCSEPEGEIVRSVRLAQLSAKRMAFLWEKLKGFDTLFNDFVKDDYQAFVNHFILEINGKPVPTGLLWDVDDVGIIFANDIVPHQSATVHFVFWDRRFRGREQLCIEMLKYGFEAYKFQRMQVEVPLYAPHTIQAMEKLGAVLEGRKRRAALYHDKWFDVNLYSFLPEDLEVVRITNSRFRQKKTCFTCGKVFTDKENAKKMTEEMEISHGRA